MQALRVAALVLALVGVTATFPGCAAAQPAPYYGDTGQGLPAQWEADLAPYGYWQTLAGYGTVWSPYVGPGWRPYTYGYWGAGSAGWVWFSSEPWAFTFHYGRWAWAPIGWVWVPGFVWGRAWVNWYWGGGYVGWAPIGYYSAVPWVQFVFVRDHDFCNRHINKVYHRHHPPDHGGGYHHGPPPRRYIEQVSHQPIVRVSESQLPNRTLPRGGGRVAAKQLVPQSTTNPRAPLDRARGGGQVTTKPPATSDTTPNRQTIPSRQYGAPRPEPAPGRPQQPGGGLERRYDPGLPRGNAPQTSPPRTGGVPTNAPPVYPSQGRPPQQGGQTFSEPRGWAPRGVPPPSQQGIAPPAPPASPPPARPPSAPTGQFQGMQPAPGFTGGARGFGLGRGFPSQGMR